MSDKFTEEQYIQIAKAATEIDKQEYYNIRGNYMKNLCLDYCPTLGNKTFLRWLNKNYLHVIS